MNFFLRAKITLSSGEYNNLRKQTEVNYDIYMKEVLQSRLPLPLYQNESYC